MIDRELIERAARRLAAPSNRRSHGPVRHLLVDPNAPTGLVATAMRLQAIAACDQIDRGDINARRGGFSSTMRHAR